MAVVVLIFFISFCCYDTQASNPNENYYDGSTSPSKLLPLSFPSKEDTLAYVDALKHSNFSQWRSLEEVAKKAGGGSCTGAINTSVLTALYLLGLFNLCAASPASCCVPSLAEDRRRRRSLGSKNVEDDPLLSPYALPPLLNSLTQNLSTLPLEQLKELPQVATPNGGKVPVHISVVEQVRKLWDSNPRLLSNLPCTSATEAVRSSFISLSGVASGIILAYSIAQLNHCYPDHQDENGEMNKIWFFPIPKSVDQGRKTHIVRSLPPEMPVEGEDERHDGCARASVPMPDGSCERLLSSRVCPYMQWVLLNVKIKQGECVPRLCGEGKVFVEEDQLCHDVNEPGFCPENQRLYLTAWGEAVCDCRDGMFFGPDKKCHRIYEQGYCYKGSVLQFHKRSKMLVCQRDQCKEINDALIHNQLPYVQAEDGSCYQFGSIGPCDGPDQFGFSIEELEPSCVSLEEAGLLQPQRSFQYSHMTFPSSFTHSGFPHFEVSYMILNGSTWELVMRTVGRQKRDIIEEFDSERHRVVPFIDTREFPQNFDEVANKFKGLETGIQNENRNLTDMEGVIGEIDLEQPINNADIKFTESKLNFESVALEEVKNISRFYRDSHMSSQSLDKVLLNGQDDNQENVSLEITESDDTNLESHTEGKSENEQKPKRGNGTNDETFLLDGFGNNNNGTNIQNINVTNEKNVQVKTDENGKDIMVKVLKGNSNPCKWHISFYSQMPNASISYNSTSINILSHPHFSRLYSGNNSSGEDEPLQALTSPLKTSAVSKHQHKDQMGEENTKQTPPNNDFDQIMPERISKVGLKDRTSDVEILVQPTGSVPSSDVNLELKMKNGTFNEHFENETSKIKKMGKRLEVSEETFEEAAVSYTNMVPSSNLGQESKMEQMYHNEDIIKVSQHNLGSKEPRRTKNKKKRNEYRKRKHRGEIRRKKNRKQKKRLRWKKKKKNVSPGKTRASSKKHVDNEKHTGKPKLKKSSEKNRFHNQSLPEYLRNRGRRQAGPKKRSKLTPGIINAPLLNQCRPGAKRDYNGYCRPKVIPTEKNPVTRRHAKAKYYEPTPPRMICKEGKRLDSRGVCRATFSGLG